MQHHLSTLFQTTTSVRSTTILSQPNYHQPNQPTDFLSTNQQQQQQQQQQQTNEKPVEQTAENRTCYNCRTSITPLWRRYGAEQFLCNACGLYQRVNGAHRPLVRNIRRNCTISKRIGLACVNCGTKATSMWRRNSMGDSVCNACGLYFRLNGVNRPPAMRKETIRTRRRRTIKPTTQLIQPAAVQNQPTVVSSYSSTDYPRQSVVYSNNPLYRSSQSDDNTSTVVTSAINDQPVRNDSAYSFGTANTAGGNTGYTETFARYPTLYPYYSGQAQASSFTAPYTNPEPWTSNNGNQYCNPLPSTPYSFNSIANHSEPSQPFYQPFKLPEAKVKEEKPQEDCYLPTPVANIRIDKDEEFTEARVKNKKLRVCKSENVVKVEIQDLTDEERIEQKEEEEGEKVEKFPMNEKKIEESGAEQSASSIYQMGEVSVYSYPVMKPTCSNVFDYNHQLNAQSYQFPSAFHSLTENHGYQEENLSWNQPASQVSNSTIDRIW